MKLIGFLCEKPSEKTAFYCSYRTLLLLQKCKAVIRGYPFASCQVVRYNENSEVKRHEAFIED